MNKEFDEFVTDRANMWDRTIEELTATLQSVKINELYLFRENALFYTTCILLRRLLNYQNEFVIQIPFDMSINEFESCIEKMRISLGADEERKTIKIKFAPIFSSSEQKEDNDGENDANS
jgi:hypothetical protein